MDRHHAVFDALRGFGLFGVGPRPHLRKDSVVDYSAFLEKVSKILKPFDSFASHFARLFLGEADVFSKIRLRVGIGFPIPEVVVNKPQPPNVGFVLGAVFLRKACGERRRLSRIVE